MKEKELKKLLDKFNAGKCTEEELALLQTLMDQLPRQEEIPPVVSGLKQSLWQQIENQTINQPPVRKLYTNWIKVAAVILIALFAGIFGARLWTAPKAADQIAYQVITAPKGQMKQVLLPDSSLVQLNAGSSIRCQVKFSETKREVTLLSGEAFFDVKHDATKPFLVHTGGVTTQVLGTSFNIKFYKELPTIQVFVSSGKVEVHDQKHTLGMYTPQQQLTYNKQTQNFSKETITGDHLLSWMHDDLILDNVEFKEVAVYLQNRYNVSFNNVGKKRKQQHYSVRFSNKLSINQVLDILQLIDGRKYRLNGDTVNIK
ncbi:FecR family protein [Mucilaginibacter dorajii]|uniref:FecR family protein n=1 Tax=Mucilaginibacter dorajii TaxID=692994 RepID=A0ABP7R3D7_9SPHI|nr:FecR family protein [Mucilaginibacter dorajii]MCS3738009.1 ferric-dicitrate binding protein FerR (iron transport regulator) [Mucilaginibacter dorajii]